MMSNKNKVVVFGGSGFLGSHLADALTDEGYETVIFDREDSPWRRPEQTFVAGDILDQESVSAVIEGAKYVYHLAGIADIGEAGAKPRETITTNIIGSTNIIEACVAHGVGRLMFASSLYVYSDRGSFYRVSKQATELLIENYSQEFGLEYTILRYGSLYGPRSQPWNGLRGYVTQAMTEGKIVYPGNGTEKREYIHVLDATRLSVDALSTEHANACLTITGTQTLTTREMLSMIKEVSGKDITLEFALSEEGYTKAHYGLTPYRYTPKQGRKLVPSAFIDIGQGILNLLEEVSQETDEHTSDIR
jgi:UDP-glucose 4-epimerase